MIYRFKHSNYNQVILERISYISYIDGRLYMTIEGFVQSVELTHGEFTLFEREWTKAHSQ